MQNMESSAAYATNPQEPPPPHSNNNNTSSSSTNNSKQLPTCIFDLFLDLPHPAASTTDRAQLIDPPITISLQLQTEMYNPENISRLSKLAFPEYDTTVDNNVEDQIMGKLSSKGQSFGANLIKYDVYQLDFCTYTHTFAIVLNDGKTRVFGHVRRYLPRHVDSVTRMDVGRRRPRVMILLTRAMGGERFYSSILKTAEAITMEAQVNKKGCFARKKNPVRSFLHALFNQHATLITQYAELRRHGLSLNFTQAVSSSSSSAATTTYGGNNNNNKSACETAKTIMEENEDLFRITLDKVEFGSIGKRNGEKMQGDLLQFYLPFTLQPGFECLHPREAIPEDIGSPIIPLLRYIGPSHFIRLLSALLCERRIIFISKSITRLSMCVRAASSILAQGMLLWRHILIPVLPPHMLRFLSVKAPYLVGILHQYASRLSKVEELTDALCVNLDSNELKTLSMTNPRGTVPDMLKRVGRKTSSDSAPNVAECLANDLDEIVKADQTLWQEKSSGGNNNNNNNTNNNGDKATNQSGGSKGGGLDASERSVSVERDMMGGNTKSKPSFIERMKNPMKKHVTKARRVMSLEEKRQYATSVDAAVAFGKMIRSSFVVGNEDDEGGGVGNKAEQTDQEPATPRYVAPSHDIDFGGVEACIVAENEGGEEDVRAALTCFFIYMYGDMGMYLSETQGTFWLDRRKFLLRKKQLGEKENSSIFVVLKKFSASSMFATHVKGRIDDMSMTARERSSIMPHHIPLFDVCSKYLSVHRLDFSLLNVRRIVAKTVLACTRHLAVERHVAVRSKALALTGDTPFDGDATVAMAELVNSCHECNTNLSVVMSVIWNRLSQNSKSILLALRMLKSLISEGPLTAITEGCDGASKIYDLKGYVDAKNANLSAEVRQTSDQVYRLLVDLPSLFARRQRIAFSKAEAAVSPSKQKRTWSDYLSSRLPLATEGMKLHALFRPANERMVYYDEGSVAPSVANSTAPSILALSRLNETLRESRLNTMYEDEEDHPFGPGEGSFDGSSEEDRYMSSNGQAPPPQAGREGGFGDEEGLFSSQEQSNENSANMLASFNYAISSRGGSNFSVSQTGSQFDESERSYDRMA